jgi:hypothetical protein
LRIFFDAVFQGKTAPRRAAGVSLLTCLPGQLMARPPAASTG